MSKIASTETISVLSRYMTAMAVVIAPKTASVASNGSDNQPGTEEVICIDRHMEENWV
jgi:hypothetical protein